MPAPELTIPLAVVFFILGGFGRRIAGGYLNQLFHKNESRGERVMGDTPARLIFSGIVALAFFVSGALWWHALLMVAAVWVGTTTGNNESLDMGRGKTSALHDWCGMELHGLASAFFPCLLVWWFEYTIWPVALSNLLIAPLYETGWQITSGNGARPRMTWPRGFRGGTEIAEFLWGGTCAVGALLAG